MRMGESDMGAPFDEWGYDKMNDIIKCENIDCINCNKHTDMKTKIECHFANISEEELSKRLGKLKDDECMFEDKCPACAEKGKRIEELEREIEQVKKGIWKYKKPDCPPHLPKECCYFHSDAPVYGCSTDKYGPQCWYKYFKKLGMGGNE